jgi:hypothetical protein
LEVPPLLPLPPSPSLVLVLPQQQQPSVLVLLLLLLLLRRLRLLFLLRPLLLLLVLLLLVLLPPPTFATGWGTAGAERAPCAARAGVETRCVCVHACACLCARCVRACVFVRALECVRLDAVPCGGAAVPSERAPCAARASVETRFVCVRARAVCVCMCARACMHTPHAVPCGRTLCDAHLDGGAVRGEGSTWPIGPAAAAGAAAGAAAAAAAAAAAGSEARLDRRRGVVSLWMMNSCVRAFLMLL